MFGMVLLLGVVSSLTCIPQEFKIDRLGQLPQTCEDCTYVNISTMQHPNGTLEVLNVAMVKDGTAFYYDFTPTEIGKYTYNVVGDKGGLTKVETLCINANSSGKSFDTKDSILYIVVLIIACGLFFLSFYGFLKLPYKNNRDEDGKIFSINDLKHVKVLLLFVSYGLLTWVMNIMIGITNNFLQLGIANKLFSFLFKAMIALVYPALIFTIIFIVINYVEDLKIGKLLDRGFKV